MVGEQVPDRPRLERLAGSGVVGDQRPAGQVGAVAEVAVDRPPDLRAERHPPFPAAFADDPQHPRPGVAGEVGQVQAGHLGPAEPFGVAEQAEQVEAVVVAGGAEDGGQLAGW